jgi:hypothetical protein
MAAKTSIAEQSLAVWLSARIVKLGTIGILSVD